MYRSSLHIHLIGIGGVGMAGIAEVLLNRGYSVSGSDLKQTPLTKHLEQLGAKIIYGHKPDNVPDNAGVVVISSAVKEGNPELSAARARNIPVIPRAEMLAELMRTKFGIAVAGSHGKTTTTSMIAKILFDVGVDPTVIVGGRVLSQPSGARSGTGEFLVAEADESDGSFRLLRPALAVVTNIDREHLSHYGSFGALEQEFYEFMRAVPFYGLVVACIDDPVVQRLAERLERRVRTYGLNPAAQLFATEIVELSDVTEFTLHTGGESFKAQLPLPGKHSVQNALAAVAVAQEVGVSIPQALEALGSFSGVARRFERVGEAGGVLVIDDYGHHPTEVQATLGALKRAHFESGARQGELVVIFQPHRFTRTRELFADFLTAFTVADRVILADIYPAGETAEPEISSEKLASHMQHPAVKYVPDLEQELPEIVAALKPGDLLLTLGAGNITNYSRRALEFLQSERRVGNL